MTEESVDLSAFDVRPRAQEGVEMQLVDPARRATKVFIRVRGRDSRAYNDVFEAQLRRKAERGPQRQTEKERLDELYELSASLVCGWRPKLAIVKGEAAVEYSPANAQRLLVEHVYIWEQVENFAGNRANFLPPPASSSSAT